MNAVTHPMPPQDSPAEAREAPALRPLVDIREDGTGITLVADLPGVPKDRLELRVEGDQLAIDAEMAIPAPDDMESVHGEVSVPRYRRVFTLSKELDPEGISADLQQGVLTIRIPKARHAQPRRIAVRVG
ncbi:MAG: heat-shock protein Hsp20 [Silanimonas sp.]|nr:MAG: heat-shock protein Hsp20 [Silanimonas sp.]